MRLKHFSSKSALQTGGVWFERSGHLEGRGGLMKDAIQSGNIGSSVFEVLPTQGTKIAASIFTSLFKSDSYKSPNTV